MRHRPRPGPARRYLDRISLLTDDITTLYQQWRRHGVAFDGPPARQAWGARTALFADLDSNRLQLVEVPRASTV